MEHTPEGNVDGAAHARTFGELSDAHRKAGDAALKLLEFADVDRDHRVAEICDECRALRRGCCHQHRVWSDGDDREPTALGHGEKTFEESRVIDHGWVADDGAIGQRGDGAFEVQSLRDRNGDDGVAEAGNDRAQLADAFGVGAAAATNIDGLSHLENVTTVEGAGKFDPLNMLAKAAHSLLHRLDLAST